MPTSPPGSRGLIDDFCARRFSPPASEVTAAEIERAPLAAERIFEEIIDLGTPFDRVPCIRFHVDLEKVTRRNEE